MDRPKFETGECVAIKSILRPDLNVRKTRITDSEYRTDTPSGVLRLPYTGWTYRVSANPHSWCESALRKVPTKSAKTFKSLISSLNSENSADRPGVIVINRSEIEEEPVIEHS